MGTFSPPFSGRIQTLESQHLTSGGAGLGPGAGERGGKAGGNDLEDSRRTWARPPALLLPGRALRPRAGRTASRGTGHRPPGADGTVTRGGAGLWRTRQDGGQLPATATVQSPGRNKRALEAGGQLPATRGQSADTQPWVLGPWGGVGVLRQVLL